MDLLTQFVLFLAATVIAVPLFRRFRLSAVLAYLASGIVIGPFGLGLVTDVESILQFAEFGVVLLLFVIGLELQPSRLLALRRVVFKYGSLQVALTSALLAAAGLAIGLPLPAALVAGFGLSLSSTPMVLQLLAERNDLKSQHGRAAFGILLFQDLAVLPALAILPFIGVATGLQAPSPLSPWRGLLLGIGALAVVIVAGRYLLRPLLRVVAETRIPDVFTAAALLLVISTALLADAAGLSMALGAFTAGVLLADSEYRHELEADLEPFKGLLLGIFFIAVGMSVNLGLVRSAPGAFLAVTAGLMVGKGGVLYLLARGSPSVRPQARSLALVMLAGGEFAFVLFPVAAKAGLLDPALGDLLILSVTFSMLLSPLLLIADDRWFSRWFADEMVRPFDPIVAEEGRVVIAGFGRFGQIVARILRGKGIPFTALEASQTQVDFVRRFGNKIFYGDASRPELLRSAQLERAEVLVIAVDDVEASLKIAELAIRNYPKLRVFARARNRQHSFRLMDLGVHYIMRETYLSSLDMAEQVLLSLGAPPAEARRSVGIFRAHDEATLQTQHLIKDDEDKLLVTTRESAQQLERLFEADRDDRIDWRPAQAIEPSDDSG